MRQHLRQRLQQLLLTLSVPVLGLLSMAMWLGWEGASLQAAGQPWWPGLMAPLMFTLAMLWGLLVVLIVLWQRSLAPWAALADVAQSRAPMDLRPVVLEHVSAPEVQIMLDALNRLLARMQQTSEAQQRFVADAAHQLRTPLAALQSQVEAWVLMAQSHPQRSIVLQAEQVDRLRQASRRTTQLAHQLLALSRVDSGLRQGTQQQRVNLKSLCEAVLEQFWDSALHKQLDLGLEAEPAHVTGDEWLLREMLVNLVDNAIKYTPAGGQVTLRCGRRLQQSPANQAFVEVEDDGPGVPLSERTRLTQRFYRTPGALGEGSGLGLAIAQEIAQGHGSALQFSAGAQERGLRVTVLFAC